MRLFRSFLADRAGNFATMTAFIAPAGIVLAALAIDAGSLYTQRRELQSLTDIAAMTAAANLTNAETAVVTTLHDNGVSTVRLERSGQDLGKPAGTESIATVVLGRYSGSLTVAAGARFVAGQTPYNAVRVKLKAAGTQYFSGSLMAPPLISTQGIAHFSSKAGFSVGSRLLSIDGGLANALLSGLLGGNVSLSVMDYNALIDADVQLFEFLNALATKIHVTGGTYSELLATQVTVGQIASALADVPGIDHRSQVALQTLALRANSNLVLKLARVLNLGNAGYLSVGGHSAALAISAEAMQILTAGAMVANGQHQIALNLGATIPGLLSATLDLAVGEPPQYSSWFTLGEAGELVRTAQTRLLLIVEVGGPGGLLGTSVKLPIYIDVAYAEAKLTEISCPGRKPANTKVTVSARPGIATLQVADIDKASLARFDRSPVLGAATIVKVPLVVTATGTSLVTITNGDPTNLVFTRADIDNGVVKTVSTRNVTQTLTGSLLQNLTLTVKLVGIDLGLSGVLKTSLLLTLTNATPAIDQLLVGVLDILGIGVGEADVRVHAATCGRAALVQ
jgi:uncharacterized membrane protein